jgi:signal transduction histidine kinase/ligand-binding sensor domain-containing protein/DNA-binding response OmpR family regulator
MKKLILFFAGFIWCISVFAEYQFEKITTHDGLSLDIVYCIAQDSEGFLYFGVNFLNIYDGSTIKIYNQANTPGFGHRVMSVIPLSRTKILVGTLDKGLFLYDKELKKIEKVDLKMGTNVLNLNILSMYDDAGGKIWIGTFNEGLYSVEKTVFENRIKNTPVSCNKYPGVENNEINSICSAKDQIWIGTRNKGLFSISEKAVTGLAVNHSSIPLSSQKIWVVKAFGDSLFIGTEEGLNVFDLKTKKNNIFLKKPDDITLFNNIVRAVSKDKSGTVWAGTQEDGLYSLKFNDKLVEIEHFKNVPTNSNTLNINKILSLFTDKNNNLWIGTWNGGVNKLSLHSRQFINTRNKGKENDLSENMVWCITKQESGKYWLGTNGSGICSLEKDKSFFSETVSTQEENSVSSLYYDKTNKLLWEGTWGNGLKVYSMPERKPILKMELDKSLLNNDRIMSIAKDENGIIWVGSITHGLFSINLKDKKQPIKYFNEFKEHLENNAAGNAEIRSVITDKNNILWVGSYNTGLFKVITDNRGNVLEVIPKSLTKQNPGDQTQIRSLFLDLKQNLWIGQESGIILLYDIQADSCSIVSQIKNKIAVAFTEDNIGNIWIAHYNGFTRYNVKTTKEQDFLTEICFYSLYFNDSDNQIIAGSNKGVYSFYPSQLKEDPFYPQIIFSELKIFNKPVNPGEQIKGRFFLNKAINYSDTLILPYSRNIFSIDITALSFNSQDKNQIYYQLENFENSWNQQIGASALLTYTNLSPGEYILKVKTENVDNVWNPIVRKLAIIILPPWWRTNSAYMGYFFVALLLGYLIFRFIRERVRIIHELKIEKIKKEQNDELNEMKLAFFTNISHEIRTPLTLILGPIEDMLENEKQDTYRYHQLTMMHKNANILHELVTQVLDFRKIEKSQTALKISRIKLNDFMLQTLEQFEGQANQKNISLQFLSKSQNIELWADFDMLQKITFNLLSNSIKFTPENGSIHVTIEGDSNSVIIKIKDDGIGIFPKDLPYIFDRFYQSNYRKVDGGSGIGLFLVKKMVEQHHGAIHVVSAPGKGSEFIVEFKKGKDHFNCDDIFSEIQESPENETPMTVTSEITSDRHKHTLLIIDDNEDIRLYLKRNLSGNYNIYDFNNAPDGLTFAIKNNVSLIICDIMMPVMDGLEFCEKIKSDIQTSHIPIILLTAKAATETKIEGYEKGADDYITKPFSIKLVQIRIKNLIEQRENLKKKIKTLNLEPSKISPTSLDEQFIGKTIACIEQNISNHEYSVDDLSLALGLSHDNFYRKIKNLTNLSATQFIRMIRLKRAVQMLENSNRTISEILYEVGFSNPSHFTKSFKEQFGVSPTEYQNRISSR